MSPDQEHRPAEFVSGARGLPPQEPGGVPGRLNEALPI